MRGLDKALRGAPKLGADEAAIVVLGGFISWLTRSYPCYWMERYGKQELAWWRWRVVNVRRDRAELVVGFYSAFGLGRVCQASAWLCGGQCLAYRKRLFHYGVMYRYDLELGKWTEVDAGVRVGRWGKPTPTFPSTTQR
jgi:hypothetical protein